MRYALIKDGLVKNIIVASPKFMPKISHDWEAVVELSDDIAIDLGWTYSNAEFTPPEIEPVVEKILEPTALEQKIAAVPDEKLREILTELLQISK